MRQGAQAQRGSVGGSSSMLGPLDGRVVNDVDVQDRLDQQSRAAPVDLGDGGSPLDAAAGEPPTACRYIALDRASAVGRLSL